MRKRGVAMLISMGYAAISTWAQNAPTDSLRVIELQGVEIMSTRANAKTPVTYTNLDQKQIAQQNFGLDIPFLLTLTPSVITTSDAGTGIGYTSIRVRGTDPTRINVTTNGIPMNDPESHQLFWVNTPDLASSLRDVQIQRGVGTSTNGSGAFGASINMRTEGIPARPFAEFNGSYGSFNTQKVNVKVGSGLLGEHWGFEARLSKIKSDGYRDRAWSDMYAYFVQAGYYADRTTVKLITFGGEEQTYHAWDGIDKETLESNRKYNPNGRISDGVFYDNQIDLYRQTHYQLLANHQFSAAWNLNVALHYTDGFGYYEEYKTKRSLKEYALTPFTAGTETISKSDLVRRKLLKGGFGGGIFSLDYKDNKLDASLGGGVNRFDNDHYGRVIWVKQYLGDLKPDHEYYRNAGKKTEANLYGRAQYKLTDALSAYADLQYRHINYSIKGQGDNWDYIDGQMRSLDISEKFGFFNPKAGLFWQANPHHSAYVSFATAGKEPTRNNYTDGMKGIYPKAEYLYDYEAGYTYRHQTFSVGINLYYMDYKDQLILNGKVNEIGEAMSENVPESYRMGVELTAGWQIIPSLRWDVNATFSRNRIRNYVQYVSDVDGNWEDMGSQTARIIGDTPIAFSPSVMGGSLIGYSNKGWNASLQTQFVGRQYLDNTGDKTCSLDPYLVNNLHVDYTFHLKHTKGVTIGATVYNLLNEKYETNGYTWAAAIYEGGDKSKPAQFSNTPYYYPMAGANVLCNVTLKF